MLYHGTFKMDPIDVNSITCIHFDVENNDKDPKYKASHHQRISKYQTISAKVYNPNLSEEMLVITKVKANAPGTYVVEDLNNKYIVGTFYEKELQNTKQKAFGIENVIKRS